MFRAVSLSLLCALTLTLVSAADTSEIICGPANLRFATLYPGVTSIQAGQYYRLVRCGYTLASSATISQSGTLSNPGNGIIKLFSAKDTNCLNNFTTTAVTPDGGVTINGNSGVSFSGTQESATGDGTMPRVCLYVTCAQSSCTVVGGGANLEILNYYGRRTIASSSSTSVVSIIIGIVVPVLICCAIVACVMRARALRNAGNVASMGAPGMGGGPPAVMAVPAGSYPAGYPGYPGAPVAYGAPGGYPPQPYGNPYGQKVITQRE